VLSVTDDDEVLMITSKGKIQRLKAADISTIGRNTQGVRVIRLDDGDTLVSCAVIAGDVIEAQAAAALESGADGESPKASETVNSLDVTDAETPDLDESDPPMDEPNDTDTTL
jgi:DNA gyrase subunit A